MRYSFKQAKFKLYKYIVYVCKTYSYLYRDSFHIDNVCLNK